MPDSYFEVLRDGRPPKRHVVRINGRDATFKIEMDRIAAQLVTPLTCHLKDLLEIASAVFLADTTVRRGGDTRPHFGARWRRDFRFHLRVRRPELWAAPGVTAALADAVEFLTGDRAGFTFAARQADGPTDNYLPFDECSEEFSADEVILFSGGLDSFAGALEALATRQGKVILVTHRSAPKAITRQVKLGEYLKRRFGGKVLHLHVRATRSGKASKDSTQRSRSLLFAALAHVVARMAGARRISFYENGVVSHNLPISPQVIETMASRTTHPLSISKLQAFLDGLGGPPIPVANPFEWLTKREVLDKIRDLGAAEAIKQTVSCTTLRNESRDVHHCGSCSQCLDRRFAILDAGLDAYDRAGDYKIDVLTEPRGAERSRTMALEWTRHACRFADMDIQDFAARFAGELARIAAAYPKDETTAVIERALYLQKRHAATVHRVIEKAFVTHGALLSRGGLPPSCLLAMYLHGVTSEAPNVEDGLLMRTQPFAESAVERQPPAPLASISPLRAAFYGSSPDFVVEVEWLGCVRREPAGVAHDLKPQFQRDLADGLAPENHRYVRAGHLAQTRRHVAENTVVQQVRRCREELAELYAAIEGHPPDHHLLIENRRNSGYRLDPTMRIVDRSQLRSRSS